ncbi:hypothetical protein [Tropicimonas sp. IMCC34043]|uniref:hypothetical protein n=1 Tax=Tropicimonas sp. IMCC34043 TaxID=2248760 RepID=UPI000E277280|nr:hypothetical protein [Tropicimonas sp. IMCC34043]
MSDPFPHPKAPPRKLTDFGALSRAEVLLRDGIGSGEVVVVSDGRPGPDAGEAVQVRASFLRYLLLGGCAGLPAPVHENGVALYGGRITGTLDLEGCDPGGNLTLLSCHFDAAPILRDARLGNLRLGACYLPGLLADRLLLGGNAVLNYSKVEGKVCLSGAKLGGDLSFIGVELSALTADIALSADRLSAGGYAFLNYLKSSGEVSLMGVKLGGDLSCTNAVLMAGENGYAFSADGLSAAGTVFLDNLMALGEVRLPSVKLGGNLNCVGAGISAGRSGRAFYADGISVTGVLVLQSCRIMGDVSLSAAQVGALCDDLDSWPKGGLVLDRFTYGAILGTGTRTDAEARIEWLKRQRAVDLPTEFKPQPWEQCAKVLREMGHADDAREVLIAKETLQRKAARRQLRGWRWSLGPLLRLRDFVLNITVRYGHRPLLAFLWLFGFWLAGIVVFQLAWDAGQFKPNSAVVLRSPEWVLCGQPEGTLVPLAGAGQRSGLARPTADGPQSQLDCFLERPEALRYPRFHALVYSADTLLPIVALEMQEFWIPDEGAGGWGAFARSFLWVQIIVGWALSLLAVAGFSGLIKSD